MNDPESKSLPRARPGLAAGAAPASAPGSAAPGLNGAESLVQTLAASGVELCLANPGTSEMHFVAALDRIPGVRCVLGLFEGVVTGAADAYYRMAGKPAATLLHLGPGLGNGLANLHNAAKARSGIVNIVGDHALAHARHESPLKSDAAGIAASVSAWVRSSQSAAEVGQDAAAAIAATRDGALGRIATLLLPADTAWGAGGRAAVAPPAPPPRFDAAAVPMVARRLRELGPRALLLLGHGGSASEAAQRLAAAIAAKTGCRVLAEFYNARMPGGRGRPGIERLPYAIDAAVARLAEAELLVLAGAADPIGFFGYPGKRSQLKRAGAALQTLAEAHEDVPAALQALADELGARPARNRVAPALPVLPVVREGRIDARSIAAAVAATLPEDAVVIDEGITAGRELGAAMGAAAPHDWLMVMGGAIGWGLPGAVGAALGAPGRPVLALEGDGSAMYTLQALWTMARESLPVTVLVFANRSYRILQGELQGVGATLAGPRAASMLSLESPALDWTALARGQGVPAQRVQTAQDLAAALRSGFAGRGPYLVEAVLQA